MMQSSETQQLRNVLVKIQTMKRSLFIYNFWAVVIKNLGILAPVQG